MIKKSGMTITNNNDVKQATGQTIITFKKIKTMISAYVILTKDNIFH
jgi:hypothetical protein